MKIKQEVAFLLLIEWFHFSVAGLCSSSTCSQCVRNPIFRCRWCPRTRSCHLPGAVLNNDCSRAENILTVDGCLDRIPSYDIPLAENLLLLSSAAYEPRDVQLCLNNAIPQNSFQVAYRTEKSCGVSRLLRSNRCAALIAISHQQRAIAIAFRGSNNINQALSIFLSGLRLPTTPLFNDSPLDGGSVHSYFREAFLALWQDVGPQLELLRKENSHYQLYITGHSLGGALASISSSWISRTTAFPRQQIHLYTFGAPRVGDYIYAYFHDRMVNNSWRVTNYRDLIVHFPQMASIKMNDGSYHHGKEVYYGRPNGATSSNAPHRVCLGKPFNEDATCSFSDFPYSIENHRTYFGIRVGDFWKTQCRRG